MGTAQLQTTESRVRYSRCGVTHAFDAQCAHRVKGRVCVQITRQHPRADFGRRIQLRSTQGHIPTGRQLGTDALGNHVRTCASQKAQVALAGQLHIIEAAPFQAGAIVIGPQQVALVAE